MQQFWLLLHHFNTKNQFRIRKKEENVCLGVWDDVTILSNLKIKKLIDLNLKVTQHEYLFQSHQVWRNGFHITMVWGTQKMWPKFKTKEHFSYLGIRFFFHFVKLCFSNWWKKAIINWMLVLINCETPKFEFWSISNSQNWNKINVSHFWIGIITFLNNFLQPKLHFWTLAQNCHKTYV